MIINNGNIMIEYVAYMNGTYNKIRSAGVRLPASSASRKKLRETATGYKRGAINICYNRFLGPTVDATFAD